MRAASDAVLINCRAVTQWISWASFGPAFGAALVATLKVFAIGATGYVAVRRRWIDENGLGTLGQLVALITLPCLIWYRFATKFDPQTFPDWWKYALVGTAITVFGLLLGKIVALRHGHNDEATMLVGFQNAGFFVLPMLQALLPRKDYDRGSLLLFVLIIPFNASLWMAGSWFLLKKRGFDWRALLTPPFVATVVVVAIYGLFHDALHAYDNSLVTQVLFGDAQSNGAVQQIGDLTVPLANLTLGGSIAASVRGRIEYKRAVVEVALMRQIVAPLAGFFLLQHFVGKGDYVVWLLLMLQSDAAQELANAWIQQRFAPGDGDVGLMWRDLVDEVDPFVVQKIIGFAKDLAVGDKAAKAAAQVAAKRRLNGDEARVLRAPINAAPHVLLVGQGQGPNAIMEIPRPKRTRLFQGRAGIVAQHAKCDARHHLYGMTAHELPCSPPVSSSGFPQLVGSFNRRILRRRRFWPPVRFLCRSWFRFSFRSRSILCRRQL